MIDFCDEIGATGIHAFTFETSDEDSSLHCRHFAPSVGVNEDPATGNGNAALAGYLLNNGKLEQEHLVVEQGYAMGHPSKLHIVMNLQTGEVSVGGTALIVLEGRLFIENL
jgi:trans-2,3-dihydro-3-hydroxyanthranilate isomerase